MACLGRKAEAMKMKAQLTLMMLMGLVMLIAVGIVLYIGGSSMTKSTERGSEQQRLSQSAIQTIRDYVHSCLDATTTAALDLIGKQGGVLYRAQGGLTPDILPSDPQGGRYVIYDGLNVSYLIHRPSQNVGRLYFAEPPDYPWVTFPYVLNKSDMSVMRTTYTGYFGISLLPPLFKPGKDSIQEQIESYISFNLPRCTDWSSFKGLSITADKPNVSVIIAENKTQIETEQYFSVVANWQVNITDSSTGSNTTLDMFSRGYPVHLAKFYVFVQSLIYSEINDSSFDPLSQSSPASPVFVFRDIFKNPEDEGADDLIIVKDAESELRGKPLEFRILRQNRYPALVWINQSDINSYAFYRMGMCPAKAQSIFLEGNQLKITYATDSPYEWSGTLSAIDPDEDNVSFSIKPEDGIIDDVPLNDALFRLFVYASDGGNTKDYQIVNLTLAGCPEE